MNRFKVFKDWFRKRILGPTPWKKQWQDKLNEILKKSTLNLPMSFVVVVTKESDSYSELLFLLAMFFMLVFSGVGTILDSAGLLGDFPSRDFLIWPALGVSVGATLFHYRRLFVRKFAAKAVRERVALRAKAIFLDHLYSYPQRLGLLYVSEVEREAIFLASPDLTEILPSLEIQKLLSQLSRNYDSKNPLKALEPVIHQITEASRVALINYKPLSPDLAEQLSVVAKFIGASDAPLNAVPTIKGTGDLN